MIDGVDYHNIILEKLTNHQPINAWNYIGILTSDTKVLCIRLLITQMWAKI